MRIEAKNLQLAYMQASEMLNCSITDLDIVVIQHPSSGVLGFFQKNAIIDVKIKSSNPTFKKPKKIKPTHNISHQDQNEIVNKIYTELRELFDIKFFDIDTIEVKIINNKTAFIRLDGKDTPLLIGKEGRVYKALSYLLFNYVAQKYELNLELEIGDFIKNQKMRISKYLENIILKVEQNGKAITKPFDSILIKIALEELREKLPNKYVGIKTSKDGKYIVISDFKK